MDGDYAILDQLNKTADISQRQLAERTGLSLATVNFILKQMIKKGLVKIERVNARSLRYIITPRGAREKAALAYRYMKHTYLQIARVKHALQQIVEEDTAQNGDGPVEVVFTGPPDEVLGILKLAATDLHLHYKVVYDPTGPEPQQNNNTRTLFITWAHQEQPGEASKKHTDNLSIDILNYI